MIDLKQTLPCATFDSQEPPPSVSRDGRKRASQVPEARKQRASVSPPPLHDWSTKARVLIEALEGALAQASPSVQTIAAIERCYAGFYLEDITEPEIAHVAHLCERAYDAIRKVRPSQVATGILNCARVLHLGLSPELRERVVQEKLVDIVRAMRNEPTRSHAVTEATMRVLGWSDKFRDRAELAVLMALRENARKNSDADRSGGA
jgi:hypothetical protein